ncbi:DUF5361 domain-containing protein [Enterococcus sp. AD013-P3]|uniref:DUF5361 domain-containing protein n=1 Tax=Enterococcus sp. AD013-P3 TaxID=3411036 RepID=UPI003B951873
MLKIDEDALACDLAETYHIYDYRQLPLTRVAVFACGLRDDSRIKLRMSDQIVPLETLLLAGISDTVSMLLWINSKDGQNGKNRPTSIAATLTTVKKEAKSVGFSTGEDFETYRNSLINRIRKGDVSGN